MKISSLNKGLVGHWTMSQDSLKGSLLADKTPYENDGTIYGATFTTDRKGKANSAMSFDGTNDYVDCGKNKSLDITGAITVSAWIKPQEKSDTYRTVISKGYNISENYQLRMGRTSEGNYVLFDVGNGSSLITSSRVALNNDTWYHIVGYYNGSVVGIYVNGIDYSGPAYSNTLSFNTNTLFIGKNISASGEYFAGSIDDVRIYNRALSETEIKTLYNSYNSKIIL